MKVLVRLTLVPEDLAILRGHEVTRIAPGGRPLVYGEALASEQAIVVGDTRNDMKGAHASGIQCVAVASHHFNVEQLCEAGADYAIGSLEQALPL
jgi:phosphoglycolate phosphatase-like HAD superfamily hydrolase